MIPDAKSLEIIKSTISVNSLIAILDPVNISSAGSRISSEGLEHEIERDLFPLITVLTPNLDEACYFANIDPDNESNDDLKVLKEADKRRMEGIFFWALEFWRCKTRWPYCDVS